MSPRQRRGALMLFLALLGALATYLSIVQYTRAVAAQLGPRRDVVVVRQDIGAFDPIDAARLDVVSVPVVFAPPGALSSPADVKGRVSPLRLPQGTFVQAASLMEPPRLVYGERAVTVSADLEISVGQSLQINDVVMVVAAYRNGSEVTSAVVVEGARVIAVRQPDPTRPQVLVTLALDTDQVLSLARARAGATTLVVGRFPAIEAAAGRDGS